MVKIGNCLVYVNDINVLLFWYKYIWVWWIFFCFKVCLKFLLVILIILCNAVFKIVVFFCLIKLIDLIIEE